MSADTTKLDQAAERYMDAGAAAVAAALKAAQAKQTHDVAFAQMHGAAAEYAALNGGRASAIEREAMERVKAKAEAVK